MMKIEEALSIMQNYMTENYPKLMENIDKNPEMIKNQVISYIEKAIKDKEIKVKEYENNEEELAKRLYNEMSGFSVLDEFFNNKEIEEINVLSWKDITIHYNNGKRARSDKHFFNAEHCKDIFKKLLEKNGMTLNKSNPIQIGYLNYNDINIRITVFGEGVFDEKLGCGASIRIVNPKKMTKENFIDNGLCNDEILNFLVMAYTFGISICLVGETGSGKTTLMSYIMENVPYHKRLITMEENTREYDLHKYDENGYMINNVVHLITKESEKESENITLQELIKTSLTSDPNYMCVSEMKGDESFQAIAAANTGHAMITTTHASSCADTYYRMLVLSKQSLKNDIDTKILLTMICRAFPIVINIEYFADNVRRISEITECIGINENEEVVLNTLYRYNVEKNIKNDDGSKSVVGSFEKVKSPSNKIKTIFSKKGATEDIIKRYFKVKD